MRTPLRVGLLTGFAVLLVGLVVGMVVMFANPVDGVAPFDRGQALGRGITPFAIAAGVIGAFVQSRRIAQRGGDA